MNSVLNRLAWICSLTLGIVTTRLISTGLFELFDFFDLRSVYYWFFVIIFTLLAKKLLLSKKFVEGGVNRFVEEKLSLLESAGISSVEKKDPKATSIPKEKPVEKETAPPAAVDEEEEALPNIKDWEAVPKLDPKPLPTAEIKKEPATPREPNFVQRFFSENLLAKVGGILLFLGVLFLLKLVYGAIGPVGKLSIGFAIGFVLYGIGLLLDKKKLVTESRVLIGTGILINYLVILSGRFLIGGGTFTDQMILNEGITFLLLIINTLLAVMTSLLYRSYTLLFFSFIVAFLNPFLVGAEASGTPYTLVGYGMIVALGALVLNTLMNTEKNPFIKNLLTISFIGGNFLFLAAPFSSSGHWLVKLVATGFLTHLVIFSAYKTRQTNRLGWYFLGGYLFLTALLIYGRIELVLQFESASILFGYLLFLLLTLVTGVIAFSATSALLIFATLALPLVILLGLAFSQVLYVGNMIYILTSVLAIYVSIFAIIAGKLAIKMQYLFFGILGLFACLAGFILQPVSYQILNYGTPTLFPATGGTLAVIISAFMFQLSTYYFSTRKELEYLYSMGTAITILLLLEIIQRQGNLMLLSVASIIGFLILNLLLPFVNRRLLVSNIKNLILGLIGGVLFTSGEIYYFGEIYFSGLQLGLGFLCQAILYFGLGYAMYVKLKETSTQAAQDVVYALLGISISLFSLAIAFVFSRHSEVVSAVWLFEAGLLFFFYNRNKDLKLFTAASILMAIGIWKLFELINQIETGEFLSLIPLFVVFGAFVAMLKFLENEKRELRWVHDVLHLVGIALLGILLVKIIPSHGHGFSILGCSIAAIVLALVYGRIYSYRLQFIFVGGLILFFFYQVVMQPIISSNLERDSLTHLIGLQYLSTVLLGSCVYLYNKLLTPTDSEDSQLIKTSLLILNAAYVTYLLVITTIYVFNIFNENSFIITIYWGLVTFALLSYGIQKDVIRWRTLGLYLLILTVSKIMLFDIWQELDAAVYRVLALMLVGALMIVISILYQKKYDGSLLKELQPENLK